MPRTYRRPTFYQGAMRSVAGEPGRRPGQNADRFAAVKQALDDGLIAITGPAGGLPMFESGRLPPRFARLPPVVCPRH
jgi:hypothetical protein